MKTATRRLFIPNLLVQLSTAALYYPNPQVHFLEHILVDNHGAYASNFSSAITPCINYVTEIGEPAINSGRTTAAQWIRVAFHDFVTANTTAGTGGIDASIGFETLRAENSGSAFNDSFAKGDLLSTMPYPVSSSILARNKCSLTNGATLKVSDLVAVGTVMSLSLCGNPTPIPFRPGRIDALTADPTTGVPAPETPLDETLEFFARSGFSSPADAIALTACGHTLGSVHHGGFPDVVPESAVTPSNTNGGLNFDSTRAVFDGSVVREYVEGTGNLGGPLVSTANVTTRSDLRLYESDGNATMRGLYDKGEDAFLGACVDVMGRMINTVPAGIALGEPVKPMEVKPVNVTFDFDSEGKLVITGRLRILSASTPPSDVKASILSEAADQIDLQLQLEEGTGSSVYGTTTYFSFSKALDQNTSYTSIHVDGTGHDRSQFHVQNDIFIVPSMTSVNGTSVSVTVSRRGQTSTDAPQVDATVPIGQQGTLGPTILHQVVSTSLSTQDGSSEYQLWQGTLDLGVQPTGAVAVKATMDGLEDALYLSAGVAGW